MSGKGRRIYVAGPMTGVAQWNRPQFGQAAKVLRAKGWTVENPVEIADAFGNQNAIVTMPGLLDTVIEEELAALAKCEAIYLLQGWERSEGTRRELMLALDRGMAIYLEGKKVPEGRPREE